MALVKTVLLDTAMLQQHINSLEPQEKQCLADK